MGRTGKKDLFPVYLTLGFAAPAVAAVVLAISGHPTLAIVTGLASALVAVPLAGRIVAGPFLEADLVVTIRANGGLMPIAELAARDPDDRLFTHLTRIGVISVADGSVALREERIGRVLAFFVRLRLAK
jgi:hypothetical protein